MTEMQIVGAVTEYPAGSLSGVQRGPEDVATAMDGPVHTGTGGRT
jgi:hypothetical protein